MEGFVHTTLALGLPREDRSLSEHDGLLTDACLTGIMYTILRLSEPVCTPSSRKGLSVQRGVHTAFQKFIPNARPMMTIPSPYPTPLTPHAQVIARRRMLVRPLGRWQSLSHDMPQPVRMLMLMLLSTRMASPLMPLHITPHTESLPTPVVRALERLLACVRVAMDLQA